MKIKAVIFDCFGVLATDGLLPFRKNYFGSNPKLLEEARERGRQVDAGLASYDDYIAWLAQAARISPAETRKQIENNVPDLELFEYIKILKSKYKIGMLSNAGANWLDEIFMPEQLELFDAVSLSYATGYIKPLPEAYETIARMLNVEADECIFVDDQERYCTAAKDAGMQAIQYEHFKDFKTKLEQLLSQSEK